MPRGGQISRQWQILQTLEARRMGVTVPDLAAELDSNVRTVYRDIEALELAGFPVYNEKDGGVERWKFIEGYRHKIPDAHISKFGNGTSQDSNPGCAICGQTIHGVDDSAVDHIKQYWMGGKTKLSNA